MFLSEMVTGATGQIQAQGNTVTIPPDGSVTVTNLGRTSVTLKESRRVDIYEDRGYIGIGALKGEWQFVKSVYETGGEFLLSPGKSMSFAGKTWRVDPGTFKYEQEKRKTVVLDGISGFGTSDPFTTATNKTDSPNASTRPATSFADGDGWSLITMLIIALLMGAGGGYLLKGKMVQTALGTGG